MDMQTGGSVMKLNRLGAPRKEDRPWTAYENGQMKNHYPTKGPRGMAAALRRTPDACKMQWQRLKALDTER